MDSEWAISSSVRRWYAVRSHPRKEVLADQQLARQGFRTFLPTYRKVSQRPTRVETVDAPFFPGYLFVHFGTEVDRWRSVNSTVGVQRIVSFGDTPAPAPRGLVEGMIESASDNGLLQFNEDLKPGEQIRLIGGPLNGHLGVFVGASEGDRVSILMTMLAREVSARVPRAQVMRVS